MLPFKGAGSGCRSLQKSGPVLPGADADGNSSVRWKSRRESRTGVAAETTGDERAIEPELEGAEPPDPPVHGNEIHVAANLTRGRPELEARAGRGTDAAIDDIARPPGGHAEEAPGIEGRWPWRCREPRGC